MAVIFWSGKGWVVPAATFGFSLLAELVSEGIASNDQHYQEHGLPLALALWMSAAVNGIVFWHCYSALFQASSSSGRKRRSSRNRSPGWIDHSCMFVNQGAWVVVLLIGGFAALIAKGV